jgi:hypothetical protein
MKAYQLKGYKVFYESARFLRMLHCQNYRQDACATLSLGSQFPMIAAEIDCFFL